MNLKQRLKKNELTIGSWVTIGHCSIVEIMATAGFDWLTVDMEHSAITLDIAQNLIATIKANKMDALVRVGKNDELLIKRVMDAGADGIIVPMVKNRSDAEKAVTFVKYPPKGRRGVGLSRAQNYGIGFDEYCKWLNEKSVIIAQVEHIESVDNISEIISTPGIDGIIIGPYDLSASMGMPGEFNNREYKRALEKVITICRSKQFPFGYHVIRPNVAELLQRIDMGHTFIAYSLDFFFLGEAARNGILEARTKIKSK